MAYINHARFDTTGTGTGTLTLTAVSGYAPTIANGSYRYHIIDTTNNARETGMGSVASMVLTRTTVEAGSNGTSAVNLGSGTKEIIFGPSALDLDAWTAAVASLTAHLADTSDAHDASAISFSPAGTVAATEVQAAIEEVASDAATALTTHTADTTDIHGIADTSTLYRAGGTDVAVADGGTGASSASGARTNLGLVIGTDVQAYSAVLAATTASFTTADETKLDGIEAGATADMTAAEILTAIKTVDGAGSGLDADLLDGLSSAAFATAGHNHSGVYEPADAELSAIAGLTSAADRLPYFTGSGMADLATFTSAGRALVDDADASAQRTTLGLGTIATQAAASVSISGGTITGITDLAVADGGTGASTASGARTNLGVVIGTDVMAHAAAASQAEAEAGTEAALRAWSPLRVAQAIAALGGGGGGGSGDLVSTNNLSDVASASTSLSNLGGQPLSAKLTSIAGLDPSTNIGKAITAVGSGDDFQLSTVATPPFAQSDVTNLTSDLSAITSDISALESGKADATHSHAISDVTGLQTALDGKATGFTLSSMKTASATCVVGELTQFDLNGASADVTATFPASLSAGDMFAVSLNRAHSSNTYAVIFADNGHTFDRSGSDVEKLFLLYTGDNLIFKVVDDPVSGTTVILDSVHQNLGPLTTTYMDSDDAGFTAAVTLSSTTGGYGNDQKYANNASTKHGTWSFSGCRPGRYQVLVCWSGDGNRSTSVRYVIGGPNTTSQTVSGLSQVSFPTDITIDGIAWKELTDNFQLCGSGSLTVEVHNDSTGYVICDAVRIRRLGPISI